MQQLSVFIVKTMRYEQLIGVSVGVQMREILRRVQLNVAGLEAIITQCPPHFRQITTFHVRQLNMNIKYLTEQVQRMLAAADCRNQGTKFVTAAGAAASLCHCLYHTTGNDYRVL